MSLPPKPIPEVQKVLGIGAHKILVVEGKIDFAVYAKWLAKLAYPAPYSATLQLVEAGGKSAVITCLRWFADNGGEPRVFGLVDRDEWDTAIVASLCAGLPQLRINPDRHAIESYFTDPQEIQPALLAIDAGWGPQVSSFQTTVAASLADYIAHWALLTVTDRLKNRMNEIGYPGHFSTTIPVPPDADIQARFVQWSRTLDTDAAFQDFRNLRQAALGDPPLTQFRSRVWAKLFFERVIQPALNGPPTTVLKSADDWMIDLAENAPVVPADVVAILQPLL
jgi:hypothetical protein